MTRQNVAVACCCRSFKKWVVLLSHKNHTLPGNRLLLHCKMNSVTVSCVEVHKSCSESIFNVNGYSTVAGIVVRSLHASVHALAAGKGVCGSET